MTDQHAHAGFVGHDGYLSGSNGPGGSGPHVHSTGSFDVDPLFGAMRDATHSATQGGQQAPAGPTAQSGYAAGHTGQFDTGAFASPYDSTGQWTVPAQATAYEPDGATGTLDTGSFHTGAFHTGAFGTGTFDTGAFHTGALHNSAPQTGAFQSGALDTGQFDTGSFDTTGQWDARAWTQAQDTGQYDTRAFAAAYDTTGQWAVPGTHADTGTYDATAWNAAPATPAAPVTPTTEPQLPYETAEFPQVELAEALGSEAPDTVGETPGDGHDGSAELPDVAVPASRAEARRAAGSRRRRTPAKRSALLTVAVPSVCVMGVAGVAVASVGGLGGGKDEGGTAVMAASDPASVKPVAANKNLDTQLANLSADANSFADRASRTQERIDLKARQDLEKKKKEDAAAAKEAARPKFVLPVTQKGLSAYYGQAGVNWMSVHTGIDFPVSMGTPVMSAIDGTVRTQWNSAYGNMAIVTGADGTETWYCHLSSTKIRSGPVKAGEVIAYSGSSGNSTGPHLHFEVRPHGGSSIDPLPWLRSHGLDPT
ncbi:M23 family metallopeptidase [Streptomyces sp. NBC_00083]|uniref:M23 family metallopeptidase n=1 Tax=Streptomyces sp. NBC_00083 TaxID=2975647 RepID=UPI0022513AC2|nr:M23 family metallopeptidase [Streptomyces sp. NBC_00083]MCX5385141.1 M23 family metallopeptidase [Streptomyces sp. NBC_00083]